MRKQREVRTFLTAEMVDLFRRGLELQKAGTHGSWESNGGRRGEWIEITKRLDWTLLHRVGEISVLDDALDDPEMRPVTLHSGGVGWDEGVKLRQALVRAIGERLEA